jgi:hypothetical protein
MSRGLLKFSGGSSDDYATCIIPWAYSGRVRWQASMAHFTLVVSRLPHGP